MKKKPSRKIRILVIDNEREITEILANILSKEGFEVFKLFSGKGVLDAVKDFMPNLILLDVSMPGMDGLQVKAQLNKDSSGATIPVIFLTGKSAVSEKVKGLGLGADDYITKPFHAGELIARIKGALRRRRVYETISMTDGITGLYNVNFFKKQFSLFFNMGKRYKKIFSLAMIDIDDLKRLNDKYGHAAGDFILRNFASTAKTVLRKADTIARYGGDEFAVILPEVNEKQAGIAVKRLKNSIESRPFTYKSKKTSIHFSFSAGVVVYDDNFSDESQMFELADQRLYEDKKRKKRRADPSMKKWEQNDDP